MTETIVEAPKEAKGPPRTAANSWREWVRENLFSSVFNGVLTVVFGVATILVLRRLLAFMFDHEREWAATSTNLRLLFAGTYPQEQFVRVWVCVGIIGVLLALTTAVWDVSTRFRVSAIVQRGIIVATVIFAVAILAPFSTSARTWYFVAGAGVLAVSLFVRGAVAKDATVPGLAVVATGVALPILSLWVIPYGHNALSDGNLIAEPGTVARTTSGPWTVVLILTIGVYLAAHKLIPAESRDRLRRPVIGLWLLLPLVTVFFILRDPDFDYGHIATTEIPIFLAYSIIGAALLYWLTNIDRGEVGRIVAAVVLLLGFATFLTPMLQLIRILMLTLALFALAAPTFSGVAAARRRYALTWVVVVLGMVWFVTAANSPSTVDTLGDWFPSGFSITLIVASFTLFLSFPLGVILALARTSKMPIFRVMSTTYIEVVRGVPFITVLVFFVIMVPLFLPPNMELSKLAAVVIAFTLFGAAYMAENVRGGLQAIRVGQHEAAEALGMSGLQKTVFIVLPQALRVSIPPLVGQAIGTFKETSLLAIVGVFDFLFIARTLISGQTFFLGVVQENLLFISVVYWLFAYQMSKASQRLEKQLGVGER